jgi:hypothetical protein
MKLRRLEYMDGEDRSRGTTKRFTREELAALAEKARGEPVVEVQPEITPMSRAQTLHDPMTTQLLAEVARRLQTMELEVPEGVGEVIEEAELDSAHPNLRRRR